MYNLTHYIDGKKCYEEEGEFFFSINPATEEKIAKIPVASKNTVNQAVMAARNAFDHGPWPQMSYGERAGYLHLIADILEENADEFAAIECADTGFTRLMCQNAHLPRSIEHFRYFAEEGKRLSGKSIPLEDAYLNLIHRVPLGVIGIIAPWSAPLAVASNNVAASLICGNTCILKPSELAPLTVSMLAEIFIQADLPPGVINIVNGSGDLTGQALADHADINGICFVGGSQVGRQILTKSANYFRRTTLELGGKSPTIVLSDANLEKAIDGALLSAFSSNGEVCVAGSRIIIEEPLYEKFVDAFVERTKKIKVGDPQAESTEMGPLISEAHLKKVCGFIDRAQQEKAVLACGGVRPANLSLGYYLQPTVFYDVENNMEIAREEIFGPVVSLMKANDIEHAIQMANDTKYGLAATIWSENVSKALGLARKIQAGNVGINTPIIRDIRNPFGGFKESGIGQLGGQWSFEQFTNVQTLNLPISPYDLPRYGTKNEV
jgi:acyl-CoA reductase-like NAD-dependent aldehyde dehydrogenase